VAARRPQGKPPAAVFYPYGYPTPYASVFGIILVIPSIPVFSLAKGDEEDKGFEGVNETTLRARGVFHGVSWAL
jgi:hypothetical protein